MKIKKIFQKLFKNTFYKFFKLIYGKITFDINNKDVKIFEINSKEILTYEKKKYKVYQIFNGRIYNDNVQNVAIISNNQIVEGPSYQQIEGELKKANHNICTQIGTPRLKKKIKGRVFNLAQGASGHSNYSHWLLDMLPKLKLYSELYNFKNSDFLYLNKLNNFQKTTLNLLDLNNINFIDSKKFRHLVCDDLVSVQHPTYFKGYILDQAQFVPKWIVNWLRDSYLEKAIKINCKEKIFIDRSESLFKHCQIINHKETINFLKDKGFEILKLENFDFKEQVYIFKNASVIISAHGAGLANLCFSKKNCKVIEIKPSKPGYAHQNKVYERISQINNLDYVLYSTPYKIDEKSNGDIFVNTKVLNDYLNGL